MYGDKEAFRPILALKGTEEAFQYKTIIYTKNRLRKIMQIQIVDGMFWM